MAITVTEGAAAKIRDLIAASEQPVSGLRVKIVGGGCSGLQYKMDLDSERAGDKLFGEEGAVVIVDRKSFLYLNGTELDFSDSLLDAGFKLSNPNARKTCGCGSSFSI
jgi:iron-sulfur cluster assembly protein